MADLFNPERQKSEITNDNNGKMSIRRSSLGRKITHNKRNIGFSEILKQNGGLPKKNECLLIKSNGCSDTGGIFHCMAQTGIVEHLYLSTWIISRTNIDYLLELYDKGKLKNLTFIISLRQKQMTGGSGKAVYAYMIEQFQKRDRIKYRVCNSHAKTFSAKVAENYYTVTGSGNWTKNPRIENYIVTNQQDIYDFNKEWMKELING